MSKYQSIIDSYLRCIEDEDFFTHFYDCFLASDPRIKQMFRYTNLEKQMELIRKGLMSMITYLDSENIGGKVTLRRLKDTHGEKNMNIQHHHYHLWKSCLMDTIRTTDSLISEEILLLWEEVLSDGINLIKIDSPHSVHSQIHE